MIGGEEVPIIGIDLGTTNSRVGIFRKGKVEIISDDQGNASIPSYVGFTFHEHLLGDAAKNQLDMNPRNTVFDVKKLIGSKWNDASVQSGLKNWPFNVINCDNGKLKIQVEHKGKVIELYPEELSAMVLHKIMLTVKDYLKDGTTPTDAAITVITVPAYFSDSQRQATRDAGSIAGLDNIKIINEPTAAAIAYGLKNKNEGVRDVIIFDFGAGYLDVSVVKIERSSLFEVKSNSGDPCLGGQDIDYLMVAYFFKDFERKYKIDISKDKKAVAKLKIACESAKCTLSTAREAIVKINSLYQDFDYLTSISREEFESICKDLLKRILVPVKKCLEDAKMDKDSIHDIVLIGGSTKIPMVQLMIKDFFNRKELTNFINSTVAVVYGAVQVAAVEKGLFPIEDCYFYDNVPFSLGVKAADGVMTTLLTRKSCLPVRKTKTFTTSSDDIIFQVFETEGAIARDNKVLGRFEVHGIPPSPRERIIEVDFLIEADGILQVSAVDKTTGRKLTIKSDKGTLSSKRLTKLEKVAVKYQDAYRDQESRNYARTSLQDYAFDTKSILKDEKLKVKLPAANQKMIMDKCDEVIEWINQNKFSEKSAFECKLIELEKICFPVATLYQGPSLPGAAAAGYLRR